MPPRDSLNAVIQVSNGNSGTLRISYGTEFFDAFYIQIVTDEGAVTITPTNVTVDANDKDEIKTTRTRTFQRESGRKRELAVFAKGIENGQTETRGDPREAFMDLKVMQAILKSAQEDGSPQDVCVS